MTSPPIGPLLRDLSDEEARAALPLTWGAVETNVVPAWIAEMDFPLAPAVEDPTLHRVRP